MARCGGVGGLRDQGNQVVVGESGEVGGRDAGWKLIGLALPEELCISNILLATSP